MKLPLVLTLTVLMIHLSHRWSGVDTARRRRLISLYTF